MKTHPWKKGSISGAKARKRKSAVATPQERKLIGIAENDADPEKEELVEIKLSFGQKIQLIHMVKLKTFTCKRKIKQLEKKHDFLKTRGDIILLDDLKESLPELEKLLETLLNA